MIVIAAHDRIDLLINLLNDLTNIDLNDHKISVIDTNSKMEEFKNEFKSLHIRYPNINFISLDYDCYDSGAYIYSFLKYNEEKSFIFLQDSIRIVNCNFVKEIDKKLESVDVLPFFNFIFSYWNEEEKVWSEQDINVPIIYPKYGFFGPMFAVNSEVMRKFDPVWFDKIPKIKRQQTAMERRWAVLFNIIGAKIEFLNYLEPNIINNFTGGNPPECEPYNTWIKKIFIQRN